LAGYSIHEFAELAGVTVKALRHYDRLGLLRPGRVGTGRYRLYQERDLERLEQIVALKFLGLPLKQVGELVEGKESLREALAIQLRAIEEKQVLLERAARVVRMAGEAMAAGEAASAGMLKKIIEVIQMQDAVESMKKYYTKEAWEKRRRYYEDGPAEEWHRLYRDINGALQEDPGGERAQALADRWIDLSLRAYQGDPNLQTDSPAAWMDRAHWPDAMKQRIAQFNLEAVHEFILKTAVAERKKYFSPEAWALYEERVRAGLPTHLWQAQVDLFRDIEAALGKPPSGAVSQALAARWNALLEERSAGDAGIKAGLLNAWNDRHNWGPRARWQFEGICMMSYEKILRCGEFIDRADAALAAVIE